MKQAQGHIILKQIIHMSEILGFLKNMSCNVLF